MTPEQITFVEMLENDVNLQLGAWARNRFAAGLSIADVKKLLRNAAKSAGR